MTFGSISRYFAMRIGSAFTFENVARGRRGGKRKIEMRGTVTHWKKKLKNLEEMMKTNERRRMTGKRMKRVKVFRKWWAEVMIDHVMMKWSSNKKKSLWLKKKRNCDESIYYLSVDKFARYVCPWDKIETFSLSIWNFLFDHFRVIQEQIERKTALSHIQFTE